MRSRWVVSLLFVPLSTAFACGGDDSGAASSDGGGPLVDGSSPHDAYVGAPDASDGGHPLDATGGADSAPDVGGGGTDASDAAAVHDASDAASDASDAALVSDASDAGAPDASDASAVDAADGGPVHPGVLAVPGTNITLWGFTSDGYLVYAQNTTSLYAYPIAGGSPQLIVNDTQGTPYVEIKRTGAAIGLTGGQGAFGVWTAAHGYHALGTVFNVAIIDVSPDGTSIAYTSNAASNPIEVAATDGSGIKATVVPQTATTWPYVWFGTNGTLTARYYAYPDASATATIHTDAFDGTTFARTMSLAGDAVSDPSGAWVWASVSGVPGSELVATSTGTVARADTTGGSGVFDATGAHLYYNTYAGALLGVPTAAQTTSVTVASSGCAAPKAVTPDGSTVVYIDDTDAGGGLSAAPTAGGGTPWAIYASYEVPYFTTDSRFVLFETGQFGVYSVPIGGGGAVSLGTSTSAYNQLTGSKVLMPIGGPKWIVIDAANTSSVTTLVGAEGAAPPGGAAVSADRATIAYVVATGASPGIYVTPVP